MEMINRLTADALDSAEFVKRLKALEHDQREQGRQMREGYSENRQQRRARERAERNAAQRAAKARP